MKFKKVNNLAGWLVCAFACTVYILTREATASLWDTGEFIASADKLQIPHPPGSPLFILLGRIFIIFFGGNNPAAAINLFSAVASGFTILFLFWTITHFARKMFVGTGEQLTTPQMITVIGAGVIGSLAYTFSDSFWFSAVEGEVYALSSFFTALVVWAMLKWEHANDLAGNDRLARLRADRWIVFIFFMLGLSIGVHLLNLLTIPAIVMIYYFKRYKPTNKGTMLAFITGCIITVFIQLIVIKYSIKLAGKMDVWFVNGLGLPFFSGFIFFFILVGFFVWLGFRRIRKKQFSLLRLGLWGFIFLMLGYSSYVTTLLRSNANPAIDMNNVDNPVTLVSYLGREQYGEAPLIYGPHFMAEVEYDENGSPFKEGQMRYIKGKKKYIPVGRHKEIRYAKKDKQLFPRIWDGTDDQQHARFYADWLQLERYTNPQTGQTQYEAPTYADNINFLFTYQAGLMYWRYFMWNFSGRQNDLQGFGNKRDSNWVTGFSFIDNQVIGDQAQLPDSLKNNKGNNKMYMIPFLLGILGCVYQFIKKRNDWIVSFLLFFCTGLAVVIYLNQPGNQPRERDYAYVGSFYAYAIWIGLAVVSLFQLAIEKLNKKAIKNSLFFGAVLTFLVAGMSYIYTSGGLLPSFMIAGSYVLLAAALVYFIRMLSRNGKNLQLAGMCAVGLCMMAPLLMGLKGWDDHDRSRKTIARDIAIDYLKSCAPNSIVITSGDNDTYPFWYAQEVEKVRPDVRLVINTLLSADWLINQLRYKINQSDPVDVIWTAEQVEGSNREYMRFYQQGNPSTYYDLYDVMKNVLGKDQIDPETGRPRGPETFPVRRFKVPVNREEAIKNGIAKPTDKIVSELLIELPQGKSYLYRNDLIILNIIAANNWKRPIYFTNSSMGLGFDHYLRKEGLLYRLVPVVNEYPQANWVVDQALRQMQFGGSGVGDTDDDRMYPILMNEFKSGGAELPGLYFDDPNRRELLIIRTTFGEAAGNLADKGRKQEAVKLLEKCESMISTDNMPYAMVSRFNQHNQASLVYLEACYKAGHLALAEKVSKALQKDLDQQKRYYEYMEDLGENMSSSLKVEQQVNEIILAVLQQVENRYNKKA